MMKIAKKHSLVNALQALLKGSVLEQVDRVDWQSATFSGERVTMKLMLCANTPEQSAQCMQSVQSFTQILPNHEFTLPRWIVADIAISSTEIVPSGIRLIIEALLIEE